MKEFYPPKLMYNIIIESSGQFGIFCSLYINTIYIGKKMI